MGVPRKRTASLTVSSWSLLAVAWLVAVLAIYWWLHSTSPAVLREQLKVWQFWNVEAIFWGFVATTATAIRHMRRALRDRVPAGAVFGASLVAVTIALFAAPQTNRIYFDEHIYQHIGQNLTDLRLAQMCNEGSVEFGILRCFRGEYNKQPTGYPHLLSVVYRLLGVNEKWAFWLNALSAAATVIVAALIAALLFDDRRAAGFAALVMALIPEQLRWSHTAASEPSSALMCAVAILAALVFARERSTAALAWAVTAAAFAVQFRLEAMLCLPLAALIVIAFAREEFRQTRLYVAALAGLILCSGVIAHLAAVRDESWGAIGARMSMSFVPGNFAVNGPFYVADWRFPLAYTFLAAAGVLTVKSLWARLIALAYFALFWAMYLVFYAGSYNFGADVRYSLMTYPPLAVLAGAGLAWCVRIGRGRLRLPMPMTTAIASIVAVQFLLYMPYVRSVGEEAWGARADVEAAHAFASVIPADGIVLTHTPSVFLLWGKNALQTSIASTEPDTIARLSQQYRGGVFLHWGFWCNVNDPLQTGFCTQALQRFPGTVVAEQRRQTYRFALYKLF